MADYIWPAEVVPYAQTFYLQSHTGGSESPFSRQRKVYGLSAARWICRMSFRGGYDGLEAQAAYGPVLDALLARLKGGQNRIGVYDFRRTTLRGLDTSGVGNVAASAGATTMVLTGLPAGEVIRAGDYIGGDSRPHILVEDAGIDGDGNATVTFEPPLAEDLAADAVVVGSPVGWFRLTSDDAGANGSQVGEAVTYDLEMVEDSWSAPIIPPDSTLTINGITILFGGDPVEIS